MEKETLKVTPAMIKEMNDEEWHRFRERSWLKKRQYYSQNMPEYYLKDKERFIVYLERVNKSK